MPQPINTKWSCTAKKKRFNVFEARHEPKRPWRVSVDSSLVAFNLPSLGELGLEASRNVFWVSGVFCCRAACIRSRDLTFGIYPRFLSLCVSLKAFSSCCSRVLEAQCFETFPTFFVYPPSAGGLFDLVAPVVIDKLVAVFDGSICAHYWLLTRLRAPEENKLSCSPLMYCERRSVRSVGWSFDFVVVGHMGLPLRRLLSGYIVVAVLPRWCCGAVVLACFVRQHVSQQQSSKQTSWELSAIWHISKASIDFRASMSSRATSHTTYNTTIQRGGVG